MSDGLLVQIMQRIISVLDEIDERKADIKDIYAEAKGHGFDKSAIGLAIREIRGRDKAESPAAQERASIVELYVSAFDNAPRTYVHVPAREAAARQSPSEGEIGSAVRAGAPASEITTPEPFSSAQSEAEAGAKPEEGSDASAAGDGASFTAQSDQFVTPAGEGEGRPGPVDTSPAAEAAPSGSTRKPYVLRPNCLRPALCGSYGTKHCGECEEAARARDDDDTDVPAFIRAGRTAQAEGDRA